MAKTLQDILNDLSNGITPSQADFLSALKGAGYKPVSGNFSGSDSKDIEELKRNIKEASTVLSKYTTVKGKLFGELQEDKARLETLKGELKDAEEDFNKAKRDFQRSLASSGSSSFLNSLVGGDSEKTFQNALKKYDELKEKLEDFKKTLTTDELEDFYNAIEEGNDTELQNLAQNKQYQGNLVELVKQEKELRDEMIPVLQAQTKEIAKAANTEEQAMRMRKQGWSDIKRGATEAYKIGKDFLDVWGKIDQAASKFAKTIGAGAVGMQKIRKNAIEAVQKGRFGAKYNVSADELIGLQETYSNTIGRNIQISASDQENMAAMFRVMGEGGGDFAQKLENFGLSYTDAANKAGKMFKEASKYGISFDKYSKNVANNIKLAQNYTFKNGVKGLESMAKKATAMRLDMQQVASFADKVSTVEGAINTGAQLQVLGGPFAQFSDPMGMLNEGLTNMEGLQDRFEKMIGSLARFNERTGEVSVSAFNKQRIKVAAEAMGMSYDQVMETTMAKGRQNYIGQQIANKGYSKEEQDLLKNIATINEGQATVSYVDDKGRKRDINLREQRLTTTQLEAIKKQTQSETDDIKDIATTLRGWDDVMQGTKKQYENTKAAVIERHKIGERTKGIVEHVAESNKLLNAILIAVTGIGAISAASGIIGGVRDFRAGGGIGGAFRGVSPAKVRQYSRITKSASGIGKLAALSKANTLKAAKAGGIASGILSGVITGIDEFGGDKNYGAGKKTMRTAGSAVGAGLGTWGGATAGAAIGTAIMPVVGTAIGGLIGSIAGGIGGGELGKWMFGGFANQKRRARKSDELGLSDLISGDYKVSELKKIAEGRVRHGSKLEAKLMKNGDFEAAMEIAQIKRQDANIDTQYVKGRNIYITPDGNTKSTSTNMARGGILNGPSHSQGGMPILGSNIEVEGGEYVVNKNSAKKFKNTLNAINSMGNGGIITPRKMAGGGSIVVNKGGIGASSSFGAEKVSVDPININLSGTIKLEGANGQKADITKELLNNPQLISEITKLITKQMNINQHGANVVNRPGA